MKYIIGLLTGLLGGLLVKGQAVLPLRADTVRIEKVGGSGELQIRNATRDSLGILVNVGGGKTRFVRAKKLNDSTIIIGLDTFVVSGGAVTASNGLTKVGNDIRLGGTIPSSSILDFENTGYMLLTNNIAFDISNANAAAANQAHSQLSTNPNGPIIRYNTYSSSLRQKELNMSTDLPNSGIRLGTGIGGPNSVLIRLDTINGVSLTGVLNGGTPDDSILVHDALGIVRRRDASSVATNLSPTVAPTTVTINSSTGTAAIIPAATFTNAGVFSATDKQKLDSAYKAFKAAFSGDTSIIIGAAILRPSWGQTTNSDTLRWNLLGIGDNHDTLFVMSVRATATGALSVRYPHVERVISCIAVTDETLAGKGVFLGSSSGTDSSIISMYVPTVGGSLVSTAGTGTGWAAGSFVWSAGTTTITPGFTIGAFDGYASSVEYTGTNNYYVKYALTGIASGTVKVQLWDRITNTQVTTAPTASDILYLHRNTFPNPINNYQFTSIDIARNVYNVTAPNQTSGANIWFYFVGKRSTN